MKVTSRFNGLCLVDRLPEELWMEFHNMVQEVVTNNFSKREKKPKKANWLYGEALEIAEERKKGKAKK